jgi:hypothetical protein
VSAKCGCAVSWVGGSLSRGSVGRCLVGRWVPHPPPSRCDLACHSCTRCLVLRWKAPNWRRSEGQNAATIEPARSGTGWLRYQRVDADVDSPEAFLARTVTRLCLDALKSARRRRETYVGPWLPALVGLPARADRRSARLHHARTRPRAANHGARPSRRQDRRHLHDAKSRQTHALTPPLVSPLVGHRGLPRLSPLAEAHVSSPVVTGQRCGTRLRVAASDVTAMRGPRFFHRKIGRSEGENFLIG